MTDNFTYFTTFTILLKHVTPHRTVWNKLSMKEHSIRIYAWLQISIYAPTITIQILTWTNMFATTAQSMYEGMGFTILAIRPSSSTMFLGFAWSTFCSHHHRRHRMLGQWYGEATHKCVFQSTSQEDTDTTTLINHWQSVGVPHLA
jgi:hypothetical protein